jgi:hypothetical protein
MGFQIIYKLHMELDFYLKYLSDVIKIATAVSGKQ